MKRAVKIGVGAVALILVLGIATSFIAYRGMRAIRVAKDFRSQIRYLIESGETIGEKPAEETFSTDFLNAIFGDNPDLLKSLQTVIQKGLAEEPSLNLGEVAAMVVTYRRDATGRVENVVAHAIGGFRLGKMKLGFHRNGYFFNRLDLNLWSSGNIFISFLGRDMVLFADEKTVQMQHRMLQSLFSGEIMPFVKSLDKPMYFTIVLPDPRKILPSQLRNHIQAIVIKGSLEKDKGFTETIMLTPSAKSASYALSILRDMKLMSEIALKTHWGGSVQETAWGPMVGAWWAYEYVKTLEAATLSEEQNIVRAKADFKRVMVNAIVKSIERMSRDLAAMRGTMEEGLDPRLVDARLSTRKPSHYWTEEHQWGPDWPFVGEETNLVVGQAKPGTNAPAVVLPAKTNAPAPSATL